VVLTGGFTKAARVLRTSQPAVSRMIRQLQDSVGFQLFARVDGHSVPTADGLLFYEEVERSFLALEKILHRASLIRERKVGHLRIVSMPALAQAFLPVVVARFLRERPGVTCSLQVQRSETIAGAVSTQQFDLGFAMLPFDRPGVEVSLFDRACGVCVMPRDHPLARRSVVKATDLRDVAVVGSGPHSLVQRALERVLSEAGVLNQVRVETPITAVACQLVKEGAGVAIADPFTAAAFQDVGLISRPFRPEVPFNFGILCPANAAPSSLVLEFLALASEVRDDTLHQSPAMQPSSA
jgi:DNA-binding transcriptional LysR family regulator